MKGEKKQHALITGASGAIGSTLVRRLLESGYNVRALTHRSLNGNANLPAGTEVITGDINDQALVQRAVTGIDVVFHLAAKLHISNPREELRKEYFEVNVNGAKCLAQAAQAAAVNRLVFFSTINVYGPSLPGSVATEDSGLKPDSLYAETKVEAEEIVRSFGNSVVLRVAAVYGPRMKGNFPQLIKAIARGLPVIVGSGLNRRTLVYVEDLCMAAILAGEHSMAAGQTYNVTDGTVHSVREIVDAISQALGRSRPKVRIPETAVRFGVGVLEQGIGQTGKTSPITLAMIDKLTEDVAVSGDKIRQQLGFRSQYDLTSGWRETISLSETKRKLTSL